MLRLRPDIQRRHVSPYQRIRFETTKQTAELTPQIPFSAVTALQHRREGALRGSEFRMEQAKEFYAGNRLIIEK